MFNSGHLNVTYVRHYFKKYGLFNTKPKVKNLYLILSFHMFMVFNLDQIYFLCDKNSLKYK